ncbi:MAG TPA: hypothetical protein VE195_11595 [Acidobacteriaceae bacterium]|nr:hypothetical protein [Acidobacteriaceae bacterium]
MYRCMAMGIALLPVIAAFPAQKPPPQRAASVKLWVDTSSGSPCERSTPASGDWMIHNNEDRNVLVTVQRILTKDGATKEDQMRDTLGPRESRELGCEISQNGHQMLTLLRAIF